MASVNWEKIKSRQQVKAIMRHDCKDTREQTKEHSNPHLQPGMTALNGGIWDTYAEAVSRYEKRYAEVNENKTVRKDAVVGLGFSIPAPDDLPEDREDEWFARTLAIMADRYGVDNIACYAVHRDERHEYIDPDTHEHKVSRTHAQGILFPECDGTMSAKKIMTKGRMAALNRAIDEMTQKEFGIPYLTGKGQRSRGSVEELKARSLQAEVEELEQKQKSKEQALKDMTRDISAGIARRDALEADLRALEDRADRRRRDAEKPFTDDERGILDELKRHRLRMQDGKTVAAYDYYLDAARQRDAAEKRRQQAEAERIAREAAAERQRQQQQAEYIRRFSGVTKKRSTGTTPAGRRLPNISHITQQRDDDGLSL